MFKNFIIVLIKPLSTESDSHLHLISPYSITPESHVRVVRIKEIDGAIK